MGANTIIISNELTNEEWFHNPKILPVFIYLLFEANTEETKHDKDIITRGSIAVTNETIAKSCGLKIGNVRVALATLEKCGEITRERRRRYQIIHIVSYEGYIES